MVAAIAAIVLVNSPLSWSYEALLGTPVALKIGSFVLNKPLLLWINDGLMAIFFFQVGLEIKRELVEGRLSSWKRAALPGIAALGGMIVPALIYLSLNWGNPETMRGWAIPSATDIAFAVGALALLGSRVPTSLKVFLLALAVLDDLGAIIIIAFFYTDGLSLGAGALALLALGALIGLNRLGVTRFLPYLVVGVVMWVCVLKSGVHATIAGVAMAMTIPMRESEAGQAPLLHHLETRLGPWVAFGIMPLFAFANAGLSLAGLTLSSLLEPVPLGIALGLFFGKQIGIFGAAWVSTRLGICSLPPGTTLAQLHGVAILGGIGFTMSLFIGTLAFVDPAYAGALRIGVLSGSILSGIAGYALLRFAAPAERRQPRVVGRAARAQPQPHGAMPRGRLEPQPRMEHAVRAASRD